MKKKNIALILVLAMCVCLAGCGQSAEGYIAGSTKESSNTSMPMDESERVVWCDTGVSGG